MFQRKNKYPVATARNRQIDRDQRQTQAFSYYANRTPGPAVRQEKPRRLVLSSPNANPSHLMPRQLSFWLFLVAVIVCLVRLVTLSDGTNIIQLHQTTVSQIYTQPQRVYREAADKLFSSSFTNNFKITADSNGIAMELERQFPELQAVSVALPLIGNHPLVYIVPAQPSVLLQTKYGGVYAVSSTGVALARLNTTSTQPVLVDQSGTSVRVGAQILPRTTVNFIESVQYQLNAGGQKIKGMVLPADGGYELDVQLQGKPYIAKFNLQGSPKEQAGALLATQHSLGTNNPASYIDLRVPGRSYYK